MLRVAVFFISITTASLVLWAQSQSQTAQTEFAVLRTDRVEVPVGETTHLNCTVVGSGDAAQISCQSQTTGCESETSKDSPYGSSPCKVGTALGRGLGTRSSFYHVSLLVGLNHVGYIVSCSGGGLLRKGCQPLSSGQVLKGTVHDGKIFLIVDGKTRSYTVETSAYIGPLTGNSNGKEAIASPTPNESASEASVKVTAQKAGESHPNGGAQANQSDVAKNSAVVLFSSEPSAADIYVDEKFIGNTPSQIQVAAGTHSIRIEAKGQKPWTREISVTPSGKITIHAVLEVGPQT